MKARSGIALVIAALGAVTAISLFRSDGAPGERPRTHAPAGRRVDSARRVSPTGSGAAVGEGIAVVASVKTVIDDGSAPVADARVLCLADPGAVKTGDGVTKSRVEAVTLADGIASLRLPHAGKWRVVVDAAGFIGAMQLLEFDGESGDRFTVELLVTPLATLVGDVRDRRGGAVPGADVVAIPPPDTARILSLLHPDDRDVARRYKAVTDQRGMFRIGSLPPDARILVQVRHQAKGRTELDIGKIGAGETREISLRLKGNTVLRGTVPRAGGESGTTVVECWRHVGGASQLALQERALLDPGSDEFELVNLSPGRKTLVYRRKTPEYLELGYVEAEAVEGEVREVGLIPLGPTSIRVIVLPEGGVTGPERIQVGGQVVARSPNAILYPFRVLIRPEAPFELRGLPEGRLQVNAMLMDASGKMPDSRFEPASIDRFERPPSIEETLILKSRNLDKKGGLSVVLVKLPELGGETADPRLALVREGEVYDAITKNADDVTMFSLGYREEGHVEVHVVCNGWRSIASVTIRARETTRVEIREWRRTAVLAGQVRTVSGEGVAGAIVQVVQLGREGKLSSRVVYEVMSGPGGSYRISGFPKVGRLAIRVSSSKGSMAPRDIDPNALLSPLELEVGE